MRSGRLRHPATIERNDPTRSATGEEVDAWSTVFRVRVGVRPLSGREYFAAQQAQSDISHEVSIRHRSGILPTDRVKLTASGRIFEIVSVVNIDERNREMKALCIERLENDA